MVLQNFTCRLIVDKMWQSKNNYIGSRLGNKIFHTLIIIVHNNASVVGDMDF